MIVAIYHRKEMIDMQLLLEKKIYQHFHFASIICVPKIKLYKEEKDMFQLPAGNQNVHQIFFILKLHTTDKK